MKLVQIPVMHYLYLHSGRKCGTSPLPKHLGLLFVISHHRLWGISRRGAGATPFTHLRVSGFDPVLVKVMAPKVALATISRVVLPAVDTSEEMRTWHTGSCGGNWGGCLHIPLTTASQGAVMLPAVGSHAEWTLYLQGVAS